MKYYLKAINTKMDNSQKYIDCLKPMTTLF